jgi:hypothetical protein
MRMPIRSAFKGVIRPVLVLGILILGLIQLLQPHFFLTSDNLSQLFPVWSEAGRHLLRGENPFVSQYLYGGGYPLYKDPTFLSCLHPVVLLISLLTATPLRFFLIDLFASLQLLGSCVAMAVLLLVLMRRKLVRLEPWQMVVLSLSYGFSGYNLVVGSFWFFYVADQVALPLYFAGLLLQKRSHGIVLIALAGVHAFLSGVPSSYLFTAMACSVAVCVQSLASRNVETVLRWIAGQVLAAVVLSPVLYFAITGFLDSSRGQGTAPIPPDMFNVPFLTLGVGWFLAGFGAFFGPAFGLINTSAGLSCTLFAAACSWWLVPCAMAACRGGRMPAWNLTALAGVVFAGLLVSRPGWLETVIHLLPFVRSSRWPFREMFLLVFFLHLWMACYVGSLPKVRLVRLLIPGVVLLVVSLLAFEPDAFLYHRTDRELLFSGTADKHWNRYKAGEVPGAVLIPVVDPTMVSAREKDLPLSLVGANNYPAYFGVRSITGYSSTPPRSALPMGDRYTHSLGYVTPDWALVLRKGIAGPVAESRIESLDPIRVSVDDGNRRLSTLVPDR